MRYSGKSSAPHNNVIFESGSGISNSSKEEGKKWKEGS